MLDLVLKLLPEDSKEPQTARILLYKLFYDQTEEGLTQFLLNLFRSFDTHKQPKRFVIPKCFHFLGFPCAYLQFQLLENVLVCGNLTCGWVAAT